MKSLTYILDLALSNKYLEVIIQCLEPKIFNEKVDVLFVLMRNNQYLGEIRENLFHHYSRFGLISPRY